MIIQVTQFMRPCGKRVCHKLEISDDCKDKYKEIIKCGAMLTGEQLMSGAVSQTIETTDGDFDIVITNGSSLIENKRALEKMILRFDKRAFEEWNKEMSN